MLSQNGGSACNFVSFCLSKLSAMSVYVRKEKKMCMKDEIQGSCLPVMAQREWGWGTCERGASEL